MFFFLCFVISDHDVKTSTRAVKFTALIYVINVDKMFKRS